MSVITYPLNGVTYDAAAVETYLCTRSSGVFAASGHFEASCAGNYKVTIGPGLAWINDGSYTGSTNRFTGKSICLTEAETLTFSAAASGAGRYDRIVLRFDRTTEPNSSYLAVLVGTAAANPAAPAIKRNEDYYDLGLYTVYRGAGTTAITAEDITSTMADSNVCGLMSDGVTGATPETMQAQYEALVSRYTAAIEATEAGSNCLLATATIPETEIATILAGGSATSTHRYLDAAGLQTFLSGTNSTLHQLGTARFVNGSVLGTKEYSTTKGWRDLVLHYQGTHLEQAIFYVNGSAAAKMVLPEGNTSSVSGYIHIRMLGQFCEITWYGAASGSTPGTRKTLTSGSTNRLTALTFGMTATAAAVGSVEVYCRADQTGSTSDDSASTTAVLNQAVLDSATLA